MKLLKTLISAMLMLAAVLSCGSPAEKARDEAEDYFEDLAEAYAENDPEDYSEVQNEYLSFFKEMTGAEARKGLYDAYRQFADQWTAQNPGKRFKEYFSELVSCVINNYETSAYMLVNLYDGAEQVAHTKADFENGQVAYKSLDDIRYAMQWGYGETIRKIFEDWSDAREAKEAASADQRLIDAQGAGPVKIGASISSLPASVEDVYDFYICEKALMEEDGDAWEETTYKFYYLTELVLVAYPSYDDPDKVMRIEVESPRFHTKSGITTVSRCGEALDAGGRGFYFVQYFRPYSGIICDGVILENPDQSYYFDSKLRRLGEEPALWLEPDDLKPLGFFSRIVVPAPGQIDEIRNLIDNWE